MNSKGEEIQANLTIGDRVIKLPLIFGTEGEVAIDIRRLMAETNGVSINDQVVKGGIITYDPGYKNTGSCMSKITYINGEEGILRYRGYNIADLAQRGYQFIDIAMLVIFDEIPTKEQRDNFRDLLTRYELLDEGMRKFFDSLPPHGDPMAILSAAIQCSSLYNPELRAIDPADP